MSDGEPFSPRRARQQQDDDGSTAPDLTPAPVGRRARRGTGFESDPSSVPTPARPSRAAASGDDPASQRQGRQVADSPAPGTSNPFARPGSAAADTPIPSPAGPVLPRSAGEFADSPGPAPRRSALSSTSPATPTAPPADPSAPADEHWGAAHRQTLLKWAAVGVSVVLIVLIVTFVAVRSARETASPSASPSATLASPTASATQAPLATVDDLVTAEDLAPVASGGWSVLNTTSTISDHVGRAACLQTATNEPNPTVTLQRQLATSQQLAALHQIDVYATAEVATSVADSRIAALSSCSEVPSYLVSSTKVQGFADQAFQITVEFQNDPALFHTVLVARTGSTVSLIDLSQPTNKVDSSDPSAVLARSQASLASAQGAKAPAKVTASPTLLPAIDPQGWLATSDLQRIRPGAGRWTVTGPGDLTSPGTQCEDMTLATEPGPTGRQQATYLLTQDSESPSAFGIDQMEFGFSSATDATSFADKLAGALTDCNTRVNTAKVKELKAVQTTAGDTKGTSRLFEIDQATSDDQAVSYQLIVTNMAKKVSYTLVSTQGDYRFTDGQLADLADRAAVRLTQP